MTSAGDGRPRALLFVGFGAFILFAPSYAQVFGGQLPVVPRWHMFHQLGSRVCDVRFFDGSSRGQTSIDRFEVLSQSGPAKPSRALRRMGTASEVDDVARRMCRAMGPATDLRAEARCASPHGWTRTHAGDRNLCATLTKSAPSPSPPETTDDAE